MNKLYVTFKKQIHSVWNEDTKEWEYPVNIVPLGYASSTNSSGNFNDKKVKDQKDWAHSVWGYSYEEINGEIWETKQEFNYATRQYDPPIKKLAEYQPVILDNIALTGFKIESVQSRSSTNNKLFRILDPRGFELEISAQNLLEIANKSTISQGVIQDACIWDFGKNGIGKAKLVIAK